MNDEHLPSHALFVEAGNIRVGAIGIPAIAAVIATIGCLFLALANGLL